MKRPENRSIIQLDGIKKSLLKYYNFYIKKRVWDLLGQRPGLNGPAPIP
jgi:hypothetical protein